MSWLSNLSLPKIRDLVRKTPSPDNLWSKCPSCERMIFRRDLEAAMNVCAHCGFHMKIAPAVRLKALFDRGAFTPMELPRVPPDPLRFRDRRRYGERIREAQAKTGAGEAIVVATGSVGGHGCVCAVFDFAFMGGSMGTGVGEAIVAAARHAQAQRRALIVFSASGGARMQEGILSLMQMARTTAAIAALKEAGLPFLSVMTDPTTGGVTASFAMLGDIQLAEPGAVIGFAGARVIEETIREKLPEGFQRAEYLLAHGMLDMVVPRSQLPGCLAQLLGHLMGPPPRAGELLPPTAMADAGAGAGRAPG